MTSGFDRDVAIVGGGPAGAGTALHLARAEGIRPSRVVVLDKARFPRDKPCAGAIGELGVDVLRAIGLPVGVPSVPMRGLRLLTPEGCGETAAPLGVVVHRREFDAHLLETARRDGVDVRDGDGLVGLARIAGGFRLETSSGETFTARYVAACDGSGSKARRLLGLAEPARRGHLYVLETEPRAVDTAARRDFVDFDLSVLADGLEGYYWDFPTIIGGARWVSRGIYHANLTPRSEVKASFARALAGRGLALDALAPRPFSTRPFVPQTTTWLDRVVLVGEAAGIDRTTGEGIAQALFMSALAASALARALRTGGTSFESYDRAVRGSDVGRHMLQSAWLAKVVYAPLGAPARHLLLRSEHARAAGIRWYRGERLPLSTQLRLGAALLASVRGAGTRLALQ